MISKEGPAVLFSASRRYCPDARQRRCHGTTIGFEGCADVGKEEITFPAADDGGPLELIEFFQGKPKCSTK